MVARMLSHMVGRPELMRHGPGPLVVPWKAKVTLVAVLLVAMVGAIDRLQAGSVLVLYVITVAAVGWRAGRLPAMLVSVAAALAWAAANVPPAPPRLWLLAWDALNRLLVFAAVGVLSELLARESLLARTDALTGLPNRRNLLDRLREARVRSRRAPTPFALAYLDLDDLKRLNEVHGHAGGDNALEAVAGAIQQTIRPGDVPARIGGDEFAILFFRLAENEAEPLAQRMRDRIAEAGRARGLDHLDVSIGIAFFEGCPERPADALDRADRALAEAKASGKGRLVTFRSGEVPVPVKQP